MRRKPWDGCKKAEILVHTVHSTEEDAETRSPEKEQMFVLF
jgi:hypothetical protein